MRIKLYALLAAAALIATVTVVVAQTSAQATNNVQITYFTSPFCALCQQVEPIVHFVAAKYGVTLVEYNVASAEGRAAAQANGVTATPTIIITNNGNEIFRSEGRVVTQSELEAAIVGAIGTPSPKATPKPTTIPAPTPIIAGKTTLDVFSPQDHTINVRANRQFTVVGWLTNDSAIGGVSVTLQQWDGTKWAAVKTTTTDAQGRCSFTHSIHSRGTYYVRMHYAGSTANEASSSEFVKVSVL